MSEWNFLQYESKDNLLAVMNREADAFIALVSDPETWQAPTASGHWQVRDVAGHLIDTMEGYFPGFDAAQGKGTAPEPLGLRVMNGRVDQGALRFRETPRDGVLERLRADRGKICDFFDSLNEQQWASMTPGHPYMGPLPVCFYPAFQLVDWAIHSWDIRQPTGRAHVLPADVADLLVPVSVVLWQNTVDLSPDIEPMTVGLRVSGRNGGTNRIRVAPEGVSVEAGEVDDLPAVLDFDAGSFVLAAFGRMNAGNAHGDVALATRFLNSIFRV